LLSVLPTDVKVPKTSVVVNMDYRDMS